MNPNYRVMMDGNGAHWIEQRVPVWFAPWLKMWRPIGELVPHWDGSEFHELHFPTRKQACAWLHEYLAVKKRRAEHAARARQRFDTGPC